jgi:hypothetical protein
MLLIVKRGREHEVEADLREVGSARRADRRGQATQLRVRHTRRVVAKCRIRADRRSAGVSRPMQERRGRER